MPSIAASGTSAASTRRAAVPKSALVLVANRQRPDDTLGSRGDPEEAKAQFQKSWDAWKAWTKMEEAE